MSLEDVLARLIAAERAEAAGGVDAWMDFVEHVAETLDIGPGTSVFDAGCGAGAFLYPLHLNGYAVGGIDPSADRVALAGAAMPGRPFAVGPVSSFDPAEPAHAVIASHGFASCHGLDDARALLARMAAKATHAIAVLHVDEENGVRLERREVLRLLAEVGIGAVQFEHGTDGRLQVYARVGERRE